MCGGHPQRPSGPTWARFAGTTVIVATLCVGAPAWADEDESTDDEARPEVTETTEVDGAPQTDPNDAALASPYSVVTVEVDASVGPSATVADILEDVAGLHVRRFGGPGDPAYVTVRGSTARQVEVVLDGVSMNPHGGTSVDLSTLPLSSFDTVEVHRGFVAGSSAIGGRVELTSKPGTSVPPRFEAGIGSWTTRRAAGGIGVGGPVGGGSLGDLRLDVAYAGTAGDFLYFDDGATETVRDDDRLLARGNNHHDRIDIGARGRLVAGPARLTLTERFGHSVGGEPGLHTSVTSEARTTTWTNLVDASIDLRAAPALTLRGGLSWRFAETTFVDPLDELGLSSPDRRIRSHQPIGSLRATWQAAEWLAVRGDASTAVDLYRTHALESDHPDEAMRVRFATTLGATADLRLFEERIAVVTSGGVHLLDNRLLGTVPGADLGEAGDGTEFTAAPTGGIAVAVRPLPWLTVRAAAAHGYRPPFFEELFGDRGGVVGNPDLRPETANTFDASVRAAGRPHRCFAGAVEAGYYRSDATDRIVFVPNGLGIARPINFDGSTVHGFEAAGSFQALHLFVGSLALTYADSTITEGSGAHVGKELPYVPTWEIDASLGIALQQWVRVSWRMNHTSATFESRLNVFEQAPRTTHSLYARGQPKPGWPWLAVEVNNLTDAISFERPRDPLHPDDLVVIPVEDFRGNPVAGRSVMVTLGWSAER